MNCRCQQRDHGRNLLQGPAQQDKPGAEGQSAAHKREDECSDQTDMQSGYGEQMRQSGIPHLLAHTIGNFAPQSCRQSCRHPPLPVP